MLSHKSTPLRDDAGVVSMPLVEKLERKASVGPGVPRAGITEAASFSMRSKTSVASGPKDTSTLENGSQHMLAKASIFRNKKTCAGLCRQAAYANIYSSISSCSLS